jgi:hypothetical protein
MAWIKVEQSLFSHRKTMALACDLDIHEAQAIGHVTALWAWALDNAPSGKLPQEDRMIARAAMWDGAPQHFIEAMTLAGFVDDDYDGNRHLHDWHEYAGRLIGIREGNKKRQQKWRQKQPKSP